MRLLGQPAACGEGRELGREVLGRGAAEAVPVVGERQPLRLEQRLHEVPAPCLRRCHRPADHRAAERRGRHVVVDDAAHLRRVHRVVEGVVQPGGVGAGAAAEADHAVRLAGVFAHPGLRRGRPAEHPHRHLLVAVGEQMVAAGPVEREPPGVPLGGALRLPAPGQPGQRPDVQRVEVQLFRPPDECGVQRPEPTRLRLAVDAVDEVDVEDREPGVADPAQRGLDLGALLRPDGRTGLRVDEGLHPQAQPRGAALGQYGEAVGGGRGGRGLDRERDRPQVGAHPVLGYVTEPLQLGGAQIGRGAAAERGQREPGALVQCRADGARLPVERVQIGGGQSVRAADPGEQVAEAAPHLAERDVQVERERVLRLARPQLTQRRPVRQFAVRRLVRVGVHVRLVRGEARGPFGEDGRRGGGGGHAVSSAVGAGTADGVGTAGEAGPAGVVVAGSVKWAYGTVQTTSWPIRWPV